MTVLLVTGSLGEGGTELSVMALARGLHARGRFRPEVVLIGDGGDHARALRREGIDVLELGIRAPLYAPRRLRRLAPLVRRARGVDVGVVHTFLFDADLLGALLRLAAPGLAIVTTRRALKAGKRRHLALCAATNPLVDRVVANSEEVRRFTLREEGAGPDKVRAIPNGVDVGRFAGGSRVDGRRLLGLPDGALAVGAVGTIKEVKGQAVLLEAARPVLAERPDAVLVLAGSRSGPYAEALAARVQAGGLEGRVLLPGSLREVPDVLAALDLFVLPSLSEGMSNALLEAMAAGRPIVATDVGGARECLAGGACGGLVPPGDPQALRAALRELLASAPLRAALGRAAADRARRVYSMDAMLDATEDLYRSVLAERGIRTMRATRAS